MSNHWAECCYLHWFNMCI